MIDLRLRSRVHPDELAAKVGKVLTPFDVNLLLCGPATVRKPDGGLLCIYVPQAFEPALLEASYPALHALRSLVTDNRGLASGTPRVRRGKSNRSESKKVPSAIIGAVDATPGPTFPYCRLTAWTGRETEQFQSLWPLFAAIGEEFARLVPDRYRAQMARVAATQPEWIVPGTPFSTITVNNTYPTGVHTDRGDLPEGFSNLTVLRRGAYAGGWLCFPEYRVGVDMGDGDLLLMDAHEWHGNTAIVPDPCSCHPSRPGRCPGCIAERISVVCYYRTRMAACGPFPAEHAKALAHAEARTAKHAPGVDQGGLT